MSFSAQLTLGKAKVMSSGSVFTHRYTAEEHPQPIKDFQPIIIKIFHNSQYLFEVKFEFIERNDTQIFGMSGNNDKIQYTINSSRDVFSDVEFVATTDSGGKIFLIFSTTNKSPRCILLQYTVFVVEEV